MTFLAQGEQRAEDVAHRLAAYIAGAQHSLDLAVYDFRLSDPLKAIVAATLAEQYSGYVDHLMDKYGSGR